jgi:hypothetical protein
MVIILIDNVIGDDDDRFSWRNRRILIILFLIMFMICCHNIISEGCRLADKMTMTSRPSATKKMSHVDFGALTPSAPKVNYKLQIK